MLSTVYWVILGSFDTDGSCFAKGGNMKVTDLVDGTKGLVLKSPGLEDSKFFQAPGPKPAIAVKSTKTTPFLGTRSGFFDRFLQ
jgi:hypothetical protein